MYATVQVWMLVGGVNLRPWAVPCGVHRPSHLQPRPTLLSRALHSRTQVLPPAPAPPRYTPEEIYDVVAAVEHYHEFVPWCVRSVITARRPPNYLEAELEVGFQMFTERCAAR